MDSPRITLHTTAHSNFRHIDGYEEVSFTDLEILLRQSREITASLEGELTRRKRGRTLNESVELGRFYNRLHNTVEELNVKERLDNKAVEQVNDAVKILTTAQTESPLIKYQTFLHDILRHCSPSLVLLCAASFTRTEVIRMKSNSRVDILAYIKDTQFSLDSSVLKTLANQYEMPSLDSACAMPCAERGG